MISRRTALGVLGAASASLAHAAPALDWQAPDTQMRMLLQMRGALDERLVISFLEGPYYGVVDSLLTPLYGLSAGLFRQYFAREDGGADYLNFELVYVTDLETGELLKTFKNPWTGRTAAPPQTRLGPSRLTITPDREIIIQGMPPGVKGYHRCRPARVVGDDVWITEESSAFIPAPANFAFNEVLTYRASAKDLADPAAPHVPTDIHFTPVIGWRPWHGMAGHQAEKRSHIMGDCAGRVVTSVNDLPAPYLRWTEEFHPDVLRDPLAILNARKG